MKDFRGTGVAMVTPFNSDKSIGFDAKLCEKKNKRIKLKQNFEELFTRQGKLKGHKVKIEFKKNAKKYNKKVIEHQYSYEKRYKKKSKG